jgi:hypothetical protein
VISLAPVTFNVVRGTQLGSLLLALKAPPFPLNCTPAVNGGGGITGTSITLEQATGKCAPVTFIRLLGGTQIGTYTVNCTTPAVASCVENTETLTAQSISPGSYTVHVRGHVGGVPNVCWVYDDKLVVPPAGGPPLLQPLNLALQSTGC